MTIDGISAAKLSTLADKFLKTDADKIATDTELTEFIKENEDDLVKMGFDTDNALDDIKDVLQEAIEDKTAETKTAAEDKAETTATTGNIEVVDLIESFTGFSDAELNNIITIN